MRVIRVALAVLILAGPIGASEPAETRAVVLATAELFRVLAPEKPTVELQTVEAVDWPDSSLGCARKGEQYLQVLVPGHRVRLWAAGTSYAVHVGAGRAVVCGVTARSESNELADRRRLVESVAAAKRDLARRLGVSADAIAIVAVDRNPMAGGIAVCPPSPEDGEVPETEGLQPRFPLAVIELETEGTRYVYQLVGDELVACAEAGAPAAESGPGVDGGS